MHGQKAARLGQPVGMGGEVVQHPLHGIGHAAQPRISEAGGHRLDPRQAGRGSARPALAAQVPAAVAAVAMT